MHKLYAVNVNWRRGGIVSLARASGELANELVSLWNQELQQQPDRRFKLVLSEPKHEGRRAVSVTCLSAAYFHTRTHRHTERATKGEWMDRAGTGQDRTSTWRQAVAAEQSTTKLHHHSNRLHEHSHYTQPHTAIHTHGHRHGHTPSTTFLRLYTT